MKGDINMKVKELIQQLKQFDGDTEILVNTRNHKETIEITGIINCVDHNGDSEDPIVVLYAYEEASKL